MANSSTYRSLNHAMKLCDYFHPDISKATQKQVEEWFALELDKPKVHRTSTGYLKPTGKKRSIDTLEDYSTQCIKFFKFVHFLEKDKPLLLFSSKKTSMPEQCEFISVDASKRKQYEKPRVTQDQIQQLIEYLWNQNYHLPKMTGCLVALLNDSGMRFGEAVTLRIKDIVVEGDYLIISIKESKTRTRTIVSILAKPYLISWLGQHPNKNDPDALVFYSRDNKKVNYPPMRNIFKNALSELNLEWKKYSSFHFLRHLFAARASIFPDFFLRYWLGWHDTSMRAHYSENTYKECLGYYKQMINSERNPMLDKKLCVLEEKQQSQENMILSMVREAVKKEMSKK